MDIFMGPDRDRPSILLGKPDYYDSPEGTNPWEKVWGLSKYAIAASLGIGTVDCALHTQVRTSLEAVNCTASWMVPLVGLSVAFSSATFISTRLRGKDDKVNYGIGALACAPVLWAWKKRTPFTLWGTTILMVVALIKKDSKENDYELFPKGVHRYGNYHESLDFSLVKEWPKRPI